MNDDYLWDRSEPVDDDVARVEEMLRPLRHAPAPLPRARGPITPRRLLAAAAVVALLVTGWRLAVDRRAETPPRDGASYAVAGLPGRTHAFVGEEIVVTAGGGAELEIGDIGRVHADPGARLRVEAATEDDHRLFLVEGGVEAVIGLGGANRFRIGSPAGMSVDLGCEYRMDVDREGVTHVAVRTGRVAFEAAGRRVIVPAGAECRTRPGARPSTPLWTEHCGPEYRAALAEIDALAEPSEAALAFVLDVADARDTLMLWHLLDSPSTAVRRGAMERIRALVDLPEGLTPHADGRVPTSQRDRLKDELSWHWRD